MKIDNQQSLSKYTSLKLGGVAKNLYHVKTVDDILEVYDLAENKNEILILGGGSNLLINDEAVFSDVINITTLEKRVEIDERDIITASASVRIQKLLKFAAEHNLGGAEYLNSLPATVGGIVAMNAGRGKSFNQMISDYIIDVRVIKNKEIVVLRKEECNFSYRNSIFLTDDSIIVSARFKFVEQDKEKGLKELKERTQHSRESQDIKYPNAGSVFKTSNSKIMNLARRIQLGNKAGICFSAKTNNWMINKGKGTFKQAQRNIKIITVLHKLLGRECEIEWQIWE